MHKINKVTGQRSRSHVEFETYDFGYLALILLYLGRFCSNLEYNLRLGQSFMHIITKVTGQRSRLSDQLETLISGYTPPIPLQLDISGSN